jgi:hypothetical protein
MPGRVGSVIAGSHRFGLVLEHGQAAQGFGEAVCGHGGSL